MSTATCPRCGAALGETDRFCGACGAPTPSGPPAADARDEERAASPADDGDGLPPDPPEVEKTSSDTTIDVSVDVGEMQGGSATGVALGGVEGDVTVNEGPETVEGDLVRGDKHVAGDEVGGDKISGSVGSIGAGAQVAIGSNIRQSGAAAPGLGIAERAALGQALDGLAEAIAGAGLPAAKAMLAAEFVDQLREALTVGEAPPDAATLKVCGAWLDANAPAAGPALAALFAHPAGTRALELAGEPATSWAAERFGGR